MLTLGQFNLSGIAPAPRGIPQIEVTFDIDANGIVHVTAMDKGTNKSADITITSSTNLSQEDIDKAVKEAQQYEAEDNKRKEGVDSRNQLDGLIFASEKAIKEAGDKLTDEDKKIVEDAIAAAKDKLASEDVEELKKATEELSNATAPVFSKLYSGTDPNGSTGGPDGGDDTEFHAE